MSSVTSQALRLQSDSYPEAWEHRVPKRVRMLDTVRADFEFLLPAHQRTGAYSGQELEVYVNQHGAVSVIFPDGHLLGVKPAEFEIIAWHPEASPA